MSNLTAQSTVRLAYIDQQKGLAMLLVVMGHVIGFCAHSHDDILSILITAIQMPFFFMLNGLVVSKIIGGGYLLKKFKQILFPFFIWGILMCLYRDKSYLEFLSDYFCLGYWYLLVVFEYFVIYFITNRLIVRFGNCIRENSKLCLVILIYIILYLGARFLTRFIPEIAKEYSHYSQLVEYFPYFILGTIIKNFNIAEFLHRCASIVMTFLLMGLIPCCFFYGRIHISGSEFINIIIRMWFCLTIFMIFVTMSNTTIKGISRYALSNLELIGKNTLAIYMIHYYLLSYVDIKHMFDYLYGNGNIIPLIVIIIAIAMMFCYLSIYISKIIYRSSLLSTILLGKTNQQFK